MTDTGFLAARLRRGNMTLAEKLWQMSWSLVFWLCAIATIGFFMLYSAANASLDPWTTRQAMRFGLGLVMLLTIAMIDIRLIMRYAYPFYAIVLALLVFVEVRGVVGGGAQRWIDLGMINLQPSELIKVALVLALARYFHSLSLEDTGRPVFLIVPLLMVFVPVMLILRQPDLGTSLMVIMGAGVLFFMSGVRLWKFITLIITMLAAIPVAWPMLAEYQKNRVLTFINPERDPLGAGYHILQSKIALGSGGLFGKGFLQGTQSHLNFLPEQQTDFIFTMLAEEMGLVGGVTLIGLYVIVLIYGFAIALRCRHQFGRLVAIGVTTTFFLYVFINVAMVMGLIPVVGVPLPLISYGGTALLTIMICMGLLMSVYVHRDVQIGVRGGYDDG
ncbi:MAG: rod shape-determining protein RodA [Rhodospirillaceae bacterium]|nr:rod shape-determining protein RodA [Rhodospirillaceae bacterium]